jgi:hypothetical protein
VQETINLESPDPDGSPAEILAEIAALPMENSEGFSGRDHDQILYGERAS